MEVPVVALATRMTRFAVGGRRSHPFVSFYASLWAAATRHSASMVCNLVATLVRTPVIPMWYCGAVLGGVGRLMSVQLRKQTRACLSARRKNRATMNRRYLTATDWRKAKTSLQLSVMVANVSAVANFALPVFVFFSSSAFTPPLLSSSLSSSSPLAVSPFFRPLHDVASKNIQETARL